MNIFVLDTDVNKAAAYHCDKHVVKMCLEYAQILCSNAWVFTDHAEYKPTHTNHPCTVWARESYENTLWLSALLTSLGEEYTNRYGKIHNSVMIGLGSACRTLQHLPRVPQTPFAQAMPDAYKDADAVVAYRRYYLGEKKGIATWKNGVPEWWNV